MSLRLAIPVLILALLAGCATSEQGRARPLAPEGLGVLYSDFDLRTRLALSEAQVCREEGCETRAAFSRRVAERGELLAQLARVRHPELAGRIAHFEFSVPDKAQVGTLSNSAGAVMILGGLADLSLDDAALDFIVAREMGHVIARHHEENTAWSIVASVAVQLLLPVANVIRGAAAALPLTSTMAATTTAASMLGSRVIKAANRPDQLDEADVIAIDLLRSAGRDLGEVARSVEAMTPQLKRLGSEGWIAEFEISKSRLDQLDCGSPWLPLAAEDIVLVASDSLVDAGPVRE